MKKAGVAYLEENDNSETNLLKGENQLMKNMKKYCQCQWRMFRK